MKKVLISSIAVAAVAIMSAVSAPAYADVAKGEKIFKKCKACHTVESGGANGMGPNLFGIVGRAAATADGFKYSDAMSEAAAGGLVWDEENLDGFLKKPKICMVIIWKFWVILILIIKRLYSKMTVLNTG